MNSQSSKELEQVTQELGEMDKEIRNIICDLYHRQFIGALKVWSLYPSVGYGFTVGLPILENGYTLIALLPYKDFLKFAREELKHTQLYAVDRTEAIIRDLKNVDL